MLRCALSLLPLLAATLPAQAAAPPRPEHPRPQLVRAEWLTLNGTWEFAETDKDDDESWLGDRAWPDRIRVPFCRESRLSGLARTGFVRNVWYRRTFTPPPTWRSSRVRLHVGAADWRSRVWVNGRYLGAHVGGSTPFSFDVTDALREGPNRVVIHVFDDLRSGLQACGKQSRRLKSHGCCYTRTTGIWQTVWLEGVGSTAIESIDCRPLAGLDRVHLTARLGGTPRPVRLAARARWKGRSVGEAEGRPGWPTAELILPLERHLWQPGKGGLYDLELSLRSESETVDRVRSYLGLRTVEIVGRAVLINGVRVFQRTVLDQGYYPDGIWTAPTDAALRRDIELARAAGFNGARLHQKVFEPRFLYWADRLGYLVWGEYTNWGLDYSQQAIDGVIQDEWLAILRRDRNHPSIVGWCPFNETPRSAAPLQARIVRLTRAVDPSRPVLETSGWTHAVTDPLVLDAHDYTQDPAVFARRWSGWPRAGLVLPGRYGGSTVLPVPFFVSEYGGIGWFPQGSPAWGYGREPKSLEAFYKRHAGLTNVLLDNPNMFGFCYTQLTDIEQERNGVYFYDRRPKFDLKRLAAVNRRAAAYESKPPLRSEIRRGAWKVLVGAAPDGLAAASWRYTLAAPPAGWEKPGFDDTGWARGRGGFGHKAGWERRTGTTWKGRDIWLRTTFTLAGAPPKRLGLVIHYDNATRVHLNGGSLWSGEGWNDRYAGFDVTARGLKLLRPGRNVVAVVCHQDEGGQFIDLGLLAER